MTLPDPSTTLRELQEIAADPTAPPERRAAAESIAGVLRALAMTGGHRVASVLSAAWHTANRWGGTANADVRADVQMPSSVRGNGAVGRIALVEALDELTRRCAP